MLLSDNWKLSESYTYENYGSRIICPRPDSSPKEKTPNLIWPNLTETDIFSYGELSYGEKS